MKKITIGAVAASAALASTHVGSAAGSEFVRHAEQVNQCSDRDMSYFYSSLGETYTWGPLNDITDQSVQILTLPRGQDGLPLLGLTRNQDNSSGEVKFTRKDLAGTTLGHSECNWPRAEVQIDKDLTGNHQLWQVGAHEILHLAGAEHGGRRDAFYPASENFSNTRTMTCVGTWEFPNYAAADTDTIAYLHYLWDPAGYRQLMADSGFENGWNETWWVIGSGAFTTGNSGNNAGGAQRGYFAPPSNTWSESIQGRVRQLSGTQTEQYRLKASVAPEASTTVTNVLLKMIHRTQSYAAGANGCDYPDGLSSRQVNDAPTPGLWTDVRVEARNNLPSGWTHVESSWYAPPGSDAHDLSVWLQGYADRPGTSAPGNILMDNMTIEGT